MKFDLQSKDAFIQGSQLDQLSLRGKKEGDRWNIEELGVGDLVISLELQEEECAIDLPFFGATFRDASFMGWTGKFYPKESILEAKLNLLNCDFNDLREGGIFSEFLGAIDLKGSLKSKSGSFKAIMAKGFKQAQILLKSKFELRNLEVAGAPLEEIDEAFFSYDSNRGLQIKFEDGNYSFFGKKYPLKDLLLSFKEKEYFFRGEFYHHGSWIPFLLRQDGKLSFFDKENSVNLDCSFSHKSGIQIERVWES